MPQCNAAMKLDDAFMLRDALKKKLSVVEEYIAIAQAFGGSSAVPPPPPTNQVALPPPPDDNRDLEDRPGQEYGAVSKAVRAAFPYMPEIFTIADLLRHFGKHGPTMNVKQIATVMNRLVKKDTTIIHQRGKGSRPTIYKKPATPAP